MSRKASSKQGTRQYFGRQSGLGILLLGLVLGTSGAASGKSSPLPEDSLSPPAGLSAEDWKKISSSLPKADIKALNTGVTLRETLSPRAGSEKNYLYYGESIALSSNTVVVGVPYEDGDAALGDISGTKGTSQGAVYIYERHGNGWQQTTRLTPSQSATSPNEWMTVFEFGSRVVLQGNTLLISSPRGTCSSIVTCPSGGTTTQGGLVFVYEKINTQWQRQQVLPAPAAVQDYFGRSIALHGDSMLVSGRLPDGSSDIYSYSRTNANWFHQSTLPRPAGQLASGYSDSLALFGNRAVAGSPNDGPGGAVYSFNRSGTSWTYGQKITPPGTVGGAPINDAAFGSALKLSATDLIVSAPRMQGCSPGFCMTGYGGVFAYRWNSGTSQWEMKITWGGSTSQEYPGGIELLTVGGNNVLAMTRFQSSTQHVDFYYSNTSSTGWNSSAFATPEIPIGGFYAKKLAVDGETIVASNPNFSGQGLFNVGRAAILAPGYGMKITAQNFGGIVRLNTGIPGVPSQDVTGPASNTVVTLPNITVYTKDSYDVTIENEPSNRICSIQNGTGIVNAADVNVTVSCGLAHTVTATASTGGQISPATRKVANDTSTTFTLSPDQGWQVDTVTGCNGTRSGNTYTTGPITANCQVQATFASVPSQIVVLGGTPQQTKTFSPFPQPLRVRVENSANQPIPGVEVMFQANPAQAVTLSQVTATTDATGIASVTATATEYIGLSQVSASVGAVQAPPFVLETLTRQVDFVIDAEQIGLVRYGQPTTYLVELANLGPDAAPNVPLHITLGGALLPATTQMTCHSPAPVSCNVNTSGNTFTLTISEILPNDMHTVELSVEVDPTSTQRQTTLHAIGGYAGNEDEVTLVREVYLLKDGFESP